MDAAIIFATEAKAGGDKVKVVATADPSWYTQVAYPIALVTASKAKTLGQAFIDYVTGPDGQSILAEVRVPAGSDAVAPEASPRSPLQAPLLSLYFRDIASTCGRAACVMSVLFPLRLSLQVAAIATVFGLIVGIPLSYMLARKRFRGKEFLGLVLTLPMVLPPVVTGYILLLVFGNNGVIGRALQAMTGRQLGIVFTWHAAALASFVVSFPFLIKPPGWPWRGSIRTF